MFEGDHTFPISIDVPSETGLSRITIHHDSHTAQFNFPGDGGGKPPLSKWTNKHSHKIEKSSRTESGQNRQINFELFICCLAALHPEGRVPVRFKDREGKTWRLDKTCAEWAAESGRFIRAEDANGMNYLVPKL
jgi:hypothetical protein